MYWKMYADYRKEHIITTGMCTPRLAEIAHCEIRNLQKCRCHLMDELHDSQKKVDNMDFLIRQIQKEK